jgi:hypothetical protein
MMGEGDPSPAEPFQPEPDELTKVRMRMRARAAGIPAKYLKRRGSTLTIDGEVTAPQLEALLFLMTDSEEWNP